MKIEICTDKKIDKNNELYSLLLEKNIINNDFTMRQFFGNFNVMELFIEKLMLFDIHPAELFETSFEFTNEVTSNDLFNIIYIIRINQLISLCKKIPEQTKDLLFLLENEGTNLIDIYNMDFNENKSGFNIECLQDIENITNAKDLEQYIKNNNPDFSFSD